MMAQLARFNKFAMRSDIIVAAGVIMIIFMMILPLPTHLLDFLIGLNISISIILLMVAIYMTSALELLAFPTILLLTTLLRLALSIASTRLILLEGEAGQIIETFGNLVVGGNLIVGIVIFLIITIVQFIVITKGAERVAEVGARFTLDGMPGKQMSIDADMRAGTIDLNEAKRRRKMVEKESQLFGSMDGAMKFVKGDAIASLIIIFVNIIGGLAIGTLQKGMPASEALEHYAILTIGDGLVAQIPALIISIAAGIIVTRVAGDDDSDLGNAISSQIAKKPLAMMVASAMLFIFALVPGLPTVTFLALSLATGAGGYFISHAAKIKETEAGGDSLGFTTSSDSNEPGKSGSNENAFEVTVPIILEIDRNVEKILNLKDLNEEISNVRKTLYMDLGVPFPGIHLHYTQKPKPYSYTIFLNEAPISSGELQPNHVMIINQLDELRILGFNQLSNNQFLPHHAITWVPSAQKETLSQTKIQYLELPQVLTYHISLILKRYAGEFMGLQETKQLLAQVEEKLGELVKEVQRLLPTQKIAEIFQRLVNEEISIRNLKKILESLIEWSQKEKEVVLLTEYVRSSLKRYISYKYSNGQNILPAYLIDQDLENTIRNAIRQTSAGSYLALDPVTNEKIVSSVKNNVGDLTKLSSKPVLLTSLDIRRYVRVITEKELPTLPVLSYQELTPDISIHPLGRVSLD